MKKWYVITSILAILLLISLVTCSGNSAEVDRAEAELADTRTELTTVEKDFSVAKDKLAKLQDDYEKLQREFTILQATKEMVFSEELRLFDISPGSSGVGGKVQNVSSAPMEKVCILVAFYEEDGSFLDIGLTDERNLFPQEVAEWWVWCSDYWPKGLFDVYAIGNKR